MFPVEGPVCAKARRWDQAGAVGLGAVKEVLGGWSTCECGRVWDGAGAGPLLCPIAQPVLWGQALPHPILLISPEWVAVVLGLQRGQVTGLGSHSK